MNSPLKFRLRFYFKTIVMCAIIGLCSIHNFQAQDSNLVKDIAEGSKVVTNLIKTVHSLKSKSDLESKNQEFCIANRTGGRINCKIYIQDDLKAELVLGGDAEECTYDLAPGKYDFSCENEFGIITKSQLMVPEGKMVKEVRP